MPFPRRLVLTSVVQANALLAAAESMHDLEMDELRSTMAKSGSFVDMTEVNPHMQRAVAIQEVVLFLKHIIPATSHTHPTIIPLTLIQAEVVDTLIDYAYDYADDTVNDPIWELKGVKVDTDNNFFCEDLKQRMNERIDALVAAAQLKAVWQHERRDA